MGGARTSDPGLRSSLIPRRSVGNHSIARFVLDWEDMQGETTVNASHTLVASRPLSSFLLELIRRSAVRAESSMRFPLFSLQCLSVVYRSNLRRPEQRIDLVYCN